MPVPRFHGAGFLDCFIRFANKNSMDKLYKNRYFLLFIVLFAYVQSIHTRMSARQLINVYTFTPEAAIASLCSAGILFLVILYFIRKWQRSDAFSTEVMLKIFGASLLVFVLIMQASGLIIAFAFDNIERNFNPQTFMTSLFSDFLDGFIYGSFFLAYYYYHKNKRHQQQLTTYHQALAESKINQLKAQLNPHFLFNNLNVLDQLIEEDKHKASDFLNEFAEIYRYVLVASDKELVSIAEELEFAEHYFRLIRHKYGNAYRLTVQHTHTGGLIVPLTLQLLLENAVQHNLGTSENPVDIHITITENICVSNNLHLKKRNKPTSGRALNNLNQQYQLVTGESITIQKTDDLFVVTIPIITQKK